MYFNKNDFFFLKCQHQSVMDYIDIIPIQYCIEINDTPDPEGYAAGAVREHEQISMSTLVPQREEKNDHEYRSG